MCATQCEGPARVSYHPLTHVVIHFLKMMSSSYLARQRHRIVELLVMWAYHSRGQQTAYHIATMAPQEVIRPSSGPLTRSANHLLYANCSSREMVRPVLSWFQFCQE